VATLIGAAGDPFTYAHSLTHSVSQSVKLDLCVVASSYRTYSSCVLELFSGGFVYGPGKHVFGAEKTET
jgi:hypothetical protein